MSAIVEGEPDIVGFIGGCICIVLLLFTMFIHPVDAYNISVGDVGASFIRWDIAENKSPIWVDGTSTQVYGRYYYQHDLSPNSKHVGCIENETCIEVTTLSNGYYVFNYWVVFLILIAFCVISYYFPITYVPALIYSIYLITIYLPNINAEFNYYLMTGILMIMNIISASRGMKR